MDDSAWNELNPRNTILFLGSGFSKDATNTANEAFLDGRMLSVRLGAMLGYASNEPLTLREISDDFIPDRQAELNETLQPLFTTQSISPDQLEITRQVWRRVYTTNYDDVYEFGLQNLEHTPEPISFHEPVRKQRRTRQVIHLHGYIHRCTNKNIDEELVLTERSYVRQLAKPRPWFDQFTDDIRFAQAVIFLGYRLADTPINALLLSAPDIREKTTFIVKSEPVSRYARQISQYGSIRPIGLSGFASHLRELAESREPSRPTKFAAFEEMNPNRDKKPLVPATTVQVRNLLTFGRFSRETCAASWPRAEYMVPRRQKISEARSALGTARTILVHSRMGNGKSVFSEIFNTDLSQSGWRCIRAKSTPALTEDDHKLLGSIQRLVLFFRTLDDATQALSQMSEPRPDMRFVIELPTSISDVRANALGRELIQPFHRIDLNKLTREDKSDFEEILNKAGIRPNDFDNTFSDCTELRDFLLRLYENKQIRTALLQYARPLWGIPMIRRVMTTAFCLKCLDLEVSPTLKREIVGEDPAAALESVPRELQGSVHDLFEFRDASVEPFSSIVSEVLLAELMTFQDILEWALRVATISGRRKQEQLEQGLHGPRFHEAAMVLGRVLQVSRLRQLLNNVQDRDDHIMNMYEEARRVREINAEPLFWLQFAILLDDPNAQLQQLEYALEHMKTGYQRASNVTGFRTYQLDTYHLRLLLHIETHRDHDQGKELSHWAEIKQLFDRFVAMLLDEAHRDFVIRVLELVEPFIDARLDSMTLVQKNELTLQLKAITDALDQLSEAIKLSSSSEPVRYSLLRSIERITRS